MRQLSQSAQMWSGVLGKDIISGRSVKAISKGDCLRSTFNEPGMCVKQNTDKFEQVNISRTNYATALLHMANAKLPKQLRDFVFHGYIRSLYE